MYLMRIYEYYANDTNFIRSISMFIRIIRIIFYGIFLLSSS